MTAGLGSGRGAFARRSRDEKARDEEGFTLVEVLITVWIMGALMVAFMGALFTMIGGSAVASRTSVAEDELRRYVEAVRAVPYDACGTKDDYEAAITSLNLYVPPTSGPVPTAHISSLKYWDKTADYNSGTGVQTQPSTFVAIGSLHGGECLNGDPNQFDDGVQQLTVTMQVSGSPVVVLQPLTITKRDNGLKQ